MTREEALLAGLGNGTSIVLAAIVRQLDAAGIMAKAQFADELDRAADQAERTQTPEQAAHPRLDFLLMRNLAKLLRGEPQRWTPTVIDGGKDE
jgi:hypothetical protein